MEGKAITSLQRCPRIQAVEYEIFPKESRVLKSTNGLYGDDDRGDKYIHAQGRIHHFIWLLAYIGDHINGVKTDNRLCNLREATVSQNNMNKGLQSNNTSGFKGVRKIKNGRWKSRIYVNGKEIHLGYFSEKSDAVAAYIEASMKLHGDFSTLPVTAGANR